MKSKMMSIEPRNEPQMLAWFRARFPISPPPARKQGATVQVGPARRLIDLTIAGESNEQMRQASSCRNKK